MSAAEQAMDKLTAQWYNGLSTGLNLSKKQFQIMQGSQALMSTSREMWNMFNAIPPESINNYYDPSQMNNFSSNYGNILSALVATSDSDFQNCMGDYYGEWQEFATKNPPSPLNAETMSSTFSGWAVINAPGKAGCVTGLTKIFINPINIANTKYASAIVAAKGFAWNKTIEQLQSILSQGKSSKFSLDTSTSNSNVSDTWAKGKTSFFFNLFSPANVKYEKLTETIMNESLMISASFGKTANLPAGPLAEVDDNNPILKKYKPWFESAALAKAYTTKDNTVWNPASNVNWENTFGKDGNTQRTVSSIVVADDIEITMSSKVNLSDSYKKEITSAVSYGVWPFFRVSGEAGMKVSIEFKDEGGFTITTKVAAGNPQILGVLQSSMKDIYS